MKKIFIVEDEKPLVEAISESLKNNGYDVSAAYNGNQAMKLLPKIKPDLILLDIVMPDVDGISFLKQLRAEKSEFKETPVIIFTNLAGEKKWIEDMGLKITDYIVKANSSLKDLDLILKKILGE